MNFIDKIIITASAGNGGRGAVAFRRELFVPNGGPSGGNGGRGGNIYFVGTTNLNTLINFRYHEKLLGNNGQPGGKSDRTGSQGADIYIEVPLGTIVRNQENKNVIADVVVCDKPYLIVRGGKGGRGNASFATSRNKAPTIFENGDLGETKLLECELKLLADIGFIGLPNAGKSTLLGAISNSKTIAGDYPFTTLNPQLAVISYHDKNFIAADLPGLIAGASEGKGLGHDFLKHIERCAVVAHLIDLSGNYGSENPIDNYHTVRKELKAFSKLLDSKPEIIIANKIDVENSEDNLKKLHAALPDHKIISISALKRQNLANLKKTLLEFIDKYKDYKTKTLANKIGGHRIYTFKAEPVEIFLEPINQGNWELKGKTVDAEYYRHPIITFDNWLIFKRNLSKLGLFDVIKQSKIEEGDHIVIKNHQLTWEHGDIV